LPNANAKVIRNPTPDTRGLGAAAKGWCGEQVDHWIHCRIKGQAWTPIPMPRYPTIIRRPELLRRVGLSHVTIWAMERDGLFPRRFALTGPADDAD
jgi:predicted DNA-binding transcriptional regulator AlpA